MAEAVARVVSKYASVRPRVLDVGCGLGQIAARVAAIPLDVSAMDVSANAVRRARERIAVDSTGSRASIALIAGSAVEIPFADESFDVVVASDGLYSWDLSPEDRALALGELRRVLASSGQIIFTEHARYHRFDELATEIRVAGFEIEQRDYLYDRPWYQFESWTRAVQSHSLVKAVRRNLAVARILSVVGRTFGPRASRHVCILARRRGA